MTDLFNEMSVFFYLELTLMYDGLSILFNDVLPSLWQLELSTLVEILTLFGQKLSDVRLYRVSFSTKGIVQGSK